MPECSQKWSRADLAQSLVAWQSTVDDRAGVDTSWWRQVLPLVRWRSPTERAQAFRITLLPATPRGGIAVRQDAELAQATTGFPLRPIGDPLAPGYNEWVAPSMMQGAWLRVRWGVGGVMAPEMVAPYPRRGAAFDLVADQVEVLVFFDGYAATPDPDPALLPVVGATMGPSELQPSSELGLGMSLVAYCDANVLVEFAAPAYTRRWDVVGELDVKQRALVLVCDVDRSVVARSYAVSYSPGAPYGDNVEVREPKVWPSNAAIVQVYAADELQRLTVSWRMWP